MRYGDEGGIYGGGSPTDPRWVSVTELELTGLREVAKYLHERGMGSFAARVQKVVSDSALSLATVLLESDGDETRVWWGSQNGSLYGAKGERRALIIDEVSHLTRTERGVGTDGK